MLVTGSYASLDAGRPCRGVLVEVCARGQAGLQSPGHAPERVLRVRRRLPDTLVA
jgi:hypothetical protein